MQSKQVLWDGSIVTAFKMDSKEFTLDNGSQIYTQQDGQWIISHNGKQVVVTDEEIEVEQQKFMDSYDWEEGYGYGVEMATEEDETYIKNCPRMD